MIVALYLAGCAGPRYQAVQPTAEGGYFIASSAAHTVHHDARYYGAFQAYGIYPWWAYTYYSPNFYPHYFSVWYPTWPYGLYGRYSRHDHGYPPHWGQPRGDWVRQTNRPAPALVGVVPNPHVGLPDRPAAGHGRQSTINLSDSDLPALRRRHWPIQPVPSRPASPHLPAASAPATATAAMARPRPAVQPFDRGRAASMAPPFRPTAQGASPPPSPRKSPARERRISRREPLPYDP